MKIFFATDSHLKGRNPSSRTDNFPKAILRKLDELCSTAKAEGAAAIIHGGDLFDVPDVSNTLIGDVASIIKRYGVPFYVIPGNHDLFGYNLSSLPQTALGVLAKAGVVQILTRDHGVELLDNGHVTVAVQGQEYYADIDKGVNNDYAMAKTQADLNLLIPHSMLLKDAFHPDIPHTLTKDVKTNADLVLVGHYHPGYDDHTIGSTRVINPGSRGRLDATKSSINRLPQYLVLNVSPRGTKKDNVLIEFRDFQTAEAGKDVLDPTHLKDRAQRQVQLQQFQKQLGGVQQYSSTDIDSIMNRLATEQALDPNVVQDAIGRIAKAQTNDKAATDTSGFVEANKPIKLTRIILENFQSHSYTDINLKDGLNAIVGQSDSGKTAVIRAIRWAIYNEPKGTDFIRTGKDDVRVYLEFEHEQPNGVIEHHFVERIRTRKNAGKYVIGQLHVDGTAFNVQTFEGFGTHMPPDIANVAQMPKSNLGRGDAETLNFAYQLEAPFMMTEGGATKAAVIGRLTGVHLVDTAIGDISTDVTRTKRDAKTANDEADKFQKELERYDYLPDMEAALKHVERKMDILQLGVKKLKDLEGAFTGLKEANKVLSTAQTELDKYEHLPVAGQRMAKLEQAFSLYQSLVSIEKSMTKASQDIQSLEEELNEIPDTALINKKIIQLEKGLELRKELVAIDNQLAVAENEVEYLSSDLQYVTDDKQALEKELEELLGSIDICPVCNRTMEEHKHGVGASSVPV